MIQIELKSIFAAPIGVVFDAERDISLHAATQAHRSEHAVAGVTSGLIEQGQEVEWEAIHFGIRQRLRVRITYMEKPFLFRDEQVSGAFKSMSHEHRFRSLPSGETEKTDLMRIEAPLGPLGRLAERVFLKAYMTRFLRTKNRALAALLSTAG
jgi:ligand-binding SRPBCC domain-containing protein